MFSFIKKRRWRINVIYQMACESGDEHFEWFIKKRERKEKENHRGNRKVLGRKAKTLHCYWL